MSVVGKLAESDKTAIRAFRANVPEAALADLHRRLAETRLPEQETAGDYSQGAPLKTVQQVLRYWQTDYDWRKVEARPCRTSSLKSTGWIYTSHMSIRSTRMRCL
jgi:hypothetical protein